MPTRSDLLEKFRQFDNQTLEKLLTYGNLFLIPEEDLLVNVTMSQMVAKGHQLADEYFPQWTDRSAADFGEFLLQLMAMFSEKDFWYTNAYANESHLRDMSVYSAAFIRAIEMGYDPVLQTSAKAAFTLVVAPGPQIVVPSGAIVVAVSGFQYTNDEAVTVPFSAQPTIITVVLREGTYGTTTVTFNGHESPLNKTGIDIDSIRLEVNNTPWQRVRVFGQSGPQSKHFSILPDSDASATVYFGDEDYGLRPSVGDTLSFTYRMCSGSGGNIKNATAAVNQFPITRNITSVMMLGDATDGTNQETLASIKNSAPLYARFKKAAFNETSTENFLLAQDNVQKAKCVVVTSGVYFYVVPKDPATVEATLLAELNDAIAPYIMYGYTQKPSTTTYVVLTDLTLELYALPKSDLQKLQQQALEVISDYTDPRVLAGYGSPFSLSELSSLLIARLTGVQNVKFLTVNGATPADVSVATAQIMQKIDPAVVTVTAYIKR